MGKKWSNGRGSVTKRADGRWMARYYDVAGNRQTLYGKREAELQERLRAALTERDNGVKPVQFQKQSLGDFLEQWIADYRAGAKKYNTGRGYESYIRTHINPALGHIRVSKLTPQDVQSFYTKLLTKNGLSSTTVRHIHSLLHLALGTAVAWGLARSNVTDVVTRPKRAAHEIMPFSTDEAKRLLGAISGNPLEALYVVAITTGMREGELMALRWSDVELNESVAHVRRNVVRVSGGGFRFEEPKSASGTRDIKLGTMAIEALQQHRRRQNEERLRCGERWDALDLVFPNRVGRPLDATNVLRQYRTLLASAGLRRIRFQDLRHTFATFQMQFKTPIKVVAAMLGHSNPQVTMNTYQHAATDLQDEAVARMDKLLAGQGV
jgi:integrase